MTLWDYGLSQLVGGTRPDLVLGVDAEQVRVALAQVFDRCHEVRRRVHLLDLDPARCPWDVLDLDDVAEDSAAAVVLRREPG